MASFRASLARVLSLSRAVGSPRPLPVDSTRLTDSRLRVSQTHSLVLL